MERSLKQELEELRDDGALSRAQVDRLAQLAAESSGAEIKELQLELECLRHNHRQLEQRLTRIEESTLFRFTRGLGSAIGTARRKAGQILLRSPLHPLVARVTGGGDPSPEYLAWIAREQESLPSREAVLSQIETWHFHPRVSVLVAAHNPKRDWFEAAIRSVTSQIYPHWQLCICDDGSREEWVSEFCAAVAADESRCFFVRNNSQSGISAALNRAALLAAGDYVTVLDHDDLLSPHALYFVAQSLQDGSADLLYSDEDYIDHQGRRLTPMFKPSWSPNLLLTCMYMGHLLVFSRARAEKAGWFRPAFDGAQDYDLALRISEGASRIVHVPRVLYHWRQHQGSSALSAGAKPYTHDAGKHAVAEALERRGVAASVIDGEYPNTYSIDVRDQSLPSVAIVICTRNARLLETCLASLRSKTDYPDYRIVVVHHIAGPTDDVGEVARRYECEVVRYEGSFHFARMNNAGARSAIGSVLVFLNDDVEPLRASWLRMLVGRLAQPEIGVTGARLLYPSGTIQHAGMTVGLMDGAGHPGRGLFRSKYWKWLDLPRDVSAVTGACMAIRRELFEKLGGFDEAFPVNYNDVDLCLRVREAGFAVVYEAGAVLTHKECQTRAPGTSFGEREQFFRRWRALLAQGDPFYSAALRRDREDTSLQVDIADQAL